MGWIRDADHNPDPLSVAQTELVALVSVQGIGPRQKVERGLLYYEDSEAAPRPARTLDDVEAELAAWEARSFVLRDLDAVLARYLEVYRFYADVLRPALIAARAVLADLPAAVAAALVAGAAATSVERDARLCELGRAPDDANLARYIGRFGSYSPVWDVAVPTDGESRARVLAMAALWAQSGRDPNALRDAAARQAARTAAEHHLAEADWQRARRAIALHDRDDAIFFAAQHSVRRALLMRGHELRGESRLDDVNDVFALPLTLPPRADLRPLVAAARAERASWAAPPPIASTLRGRGGSGHARGRAVVVRTLDELPTMFPADAIIVLPAFLPSHSFLLATARALVVATGGLLSHGAILAREYGVPFIVGVADAPSIPDGAELVVDGSGAAVLLVGG